MDLDTGAQDRQARAGAARLRAGAHRHRRGHPPPAGRGRDARRHPLHPRARQRRQAAQRARRRRAHRRRRRFLHRDRGRRVDARARQAGDARHAGGAPARARLRPGRRRASRATCSTSHGIEIVAAADVARVRRRGRRRRPSSTPSSAPTGARIEADLVVVGVGANPDVMLARKAKLELGEQRRRRLRPHAAHVGRGSLRGGRHVRVRQRRARPPAAHRARGGRRRAGPPRRAGDARLRPSPTARCRTSGRTSPTGRRSSTSAGAAAWDEEIVRGDPADGAFSVFYGLEGKVVGALAVGRADDLDAARELIAAGAEVGALSR